MSRVVCGWSCYETYGIGIPNFDFAGYTYTEAKSMVADGSHRWALCHGGVLRLVSRDYQLGEWECFLDQVADRHFEKVR